MILPWLSVDIVSHHLVASWDLCLSTTTHRLSLSSHDRKITMSSNNNPWAWLGLLKWSLSYTDGTAPSNLNSQLSAEDKAFLEAVMQEGIIDENERMKTILKEMMELLEKWRTDGTRTEEEVERVDDLLEELRDIVEQIDYSRAFAAIKGLDFVLGCVQEESIPTSTKIGCLGLMSTLCQHNPPVQQQFLELGSIRILSDIFFATSESGDSAQFQAKLVQAISANVRSFELAEAVFSQLEQAPALINRGLESSSAQLKKRTLFFLRAFLTSDVSEQLRVARFANSISCCIDHFVLNAACDGELAEIAVSLVNQLLEKQFAVDTILERKTDIVGRGVKRVSDLRKLTGEDADLHRTELEQWESCIQLLARQNLPAASILSQ